MPFVPAVCYDCHTVFSSQLFVRDIRINLSGLEVHKCPNCSEKGRIVGGMYEFIDYTLTVLKNENHSIYELNMLYDTFMLARELNISPKRLKRDIKKNFPEFQDLLLLLPETNEDYQLCLSILTQVLLAVIEMSVAEHFHHKETKDLVKIVQNIKVNQTIDQIYSQNTGIKKRFL